MRFHVAAGRFARALKALRAGPRRWRFPSWLLAAGLSACTAGGAQPASSPSGPAWDGRANQSLRLPAGGDCLGWLERLGIAHRVLGPTRGVHTPVEVVGPIAGVRYFSAGRESVVADCRLILALDWVGPQLVALGVSSVRHSGAYVYRTTSSGRPSLHAQGLAIDLHGFAIGTQSYEVASGYARGRTGCDNGGLPLPNRVHCALRATGLFRELITPDHNADHHDHIHAAIAQAP